jgi:hypothetical protein
MICSFEGDAVRTVPPRGYLWQMTAVTQTPRRFTRQEVQK